jgi:GNAT superfamily N-acetyltransferase
VTAYEMRDIVCAQLAADLNCTPDDLNGEKDGFVFTQARENPGRRPFPRGEQHFEMLSMGRSIVVSASPAILDIVMPLLHGKDRDTEFSMPFVYGHSLYYLPDLTQIKPLASPDGFGYEVVEHQEIPALYQYEGFSNALQYDAKHNRPDVLVTLAKKGDQVVGMAGASKDCMMMWQVGMVVLPEYRGCGLAAYLVNRLTLEILSRGYVPYYGTASSNVASQRVAHRASLTPAWICAYQGRLDGYSLSPTG